MFGEFQSDPIPSINEVTNGVTGPFWMASSEKGFSGVTWVTSNEQNLGWFGLYKELYYPVIGIIINHYEDFQDPY